MAYNSLIKGLKASTFYSLATKVIAFISTVFVARYLEPSDFGVIAMINVFVEFMNMIAEGGLSYAIIKNDYHDYFHSAVHKFVVLVGGIMSIGMMLLSPLIAIFYNNPSLVLPSIIISNLFLIKAVGITPMAMLSKELRFSEIGRITTLSMFISVICTILLAMVGLGYWSLIIGQVINAILGAILSYNKVKDRISFMGFSFVKMKGVYARVGHTIKNVIGFRVVNYWARNADNLYIGRFYSVAELGIYERAYKLFILPMGLINSVLSQVMLPILKKDLSSERRVNRTYGMILNGVSLVILPLSLIFIFIPTEFINFIWGNQWLQVAEILPYFGVLILNQALMTTSGLVLVLKGKEVILRRLGWVSSVIIVGAIILGGMTSFISVPKYYAIAYLMIVLPLNVYLVYFKVLKFSFWRNVSIWLVRLIFSCLALYYQLYSVRGEVIFACLLLLVGCDIFGIYKGVKDSIDEDSINNRVISTY